jgi:DNA polymerase III subunit gamma/tau
VLTFKSAFHAKFVQDNPEPLVEALYEVLGGSWQVRAELSGQPDAGRAATAARPAEQARPAAVAEAVPSTSDDDWPTPASPGAQAPPAPAPTPAKKAAPARRTNPARTTPVKPTQPAPVEGFDPGDEPLDDDAEPGSVRRSSEEQAMMNLGESFVVERISDAG